MQTKPTPKIHPLSILGVLLVAGVLLGISWMVFSMAIGQAERAETTPQYNVTVFLPQHRRILSLLPQNCPRPPRKHRSFYRTEPLG